MVQTLDALDAFIVNLTFFLPLLYPTHKRSLYTLLNHHSHMVPSLSAEYDPYMV